MSDETTTIAELRRAVADFVAEREWQKYHDPKNLAMSIAIEVAELMEHLQWLRSDQLEAALAEQHIRAGIREELADVICFALAFANAADIDIAQAVREKLEKNAAKYPVEQFRGHYERPAAGADA